MNQDDNLFADNLASAWSVETPDITARVASAIGGVAHPASEAGELLAELRSMRQEMGELRLTTLRLHEEMLRLRLELTSRPAVRIAPFAPSEGLIRLQ